VAVMLVDSSDIPVVLPRHATPTQNSQSITEINYNASAISSLSAHHRNHIDLASTRQLGKLMGFICHLVTVSAGRYTIILGNTVLQYPIGLMLQIYPTIVSLVTRQPPPPPPPLYGHTRQHSAENRTVLSVFLRTTRRGAHWMLVCTEPRTGSRRRTSGGGSKGLPPTGMSLCI